MRQLAPPSNPPLWHEYAGTPVVGETKLELGITSPVVVDSAHTAAAAVAPFGVTQRSAMGDRPPGQVVIPAYPAILDRTVLVPELRLPPQPALSALAPADANPAEANPAAQTGVVNVPPAGSAVARVLPNELIQRKWLLPTMFTTVIVAFLCAGLLASQQSVVEAAVSQNEPAAEVRHASAPVQCVTTVGPKQIAAAVNAKVPVSLRARLGTTEVLLGMARDDKRALGFRVDATDLKTDAVFEREVTRAVLGIVPMVAPNAVSFAVDEASVGHLREVRTIDALDPFKLGLTNSGLSTSRRTNGKLSTIWELGDSESIGRPEVQNESAVSHVIALRQGEVQSKVLVGWYNSQTQRASSLQILPFNAAHVGAPELSLHNDTAVVVASVRETVGLPWTLKYSTVRAGQAPSEARSIALPLGGPGHDRIAPRLAALDEGRWLLQWTEGPAGSRVVRVATFNQGFEVIGGGITLSAQGKNAGAGAVVAIDGGALSTFLVQSVTGYELWAASLSCH